VLALRERQPRDAPAPHTGGAHPSLPEVTPEQARTEPARGGGYWVCARCARFVVDGRARIEVDGAFAHSFINPAGAIFRVGCFAAAPGAVPWGEPSAHWTWFPGFEWRVAVCRSCATHLGWLYTAANASFVGLILDRIVEHPATGPNVS
jgi:hypothetical protein